MAFSHPTEGVPVPVSLPARRERPHTGGQHRQLSARGCRLFALFSPLDLSAGTTCFSQIQHL
ncbi:hypothetical protein [Kamptonema formosum]|uniref:hypothetical protein n=1 Tax=Kamptonema formosum TaxID=331992 RepID=UPI0003495027|nr:hypothetical protein [Oscillatoria sp. PCC 10802]